MRKPYFTHPLLLAQHIKLAETPNGGVPLEPMPDNQEGFSLTIAVFCLGALLGIAGSYHFIVWVADQL